jgi:hypothetical protein
LLKRKSLGKPLSKFRYLLNFRSSTNDSCELLSAF